MPTKDKAVRDAAEKLHSAIKSAEGAGYRVTWPSTPDGLRGIAVSETAKVEPKPDVKPVPTIKNPNPEGAEKPSEKKSSAKS